MIPKLKFGKIYEKGHNNKVINKIKSNQLTKLELLK